MIHDERLWFVVVRGCDKSSIVECGEGGGNGFVWLVVCGLFVVAVDVVVVVVVERCLVTGELGGRITLASDGDDGRKLSRSTLFFDAPTANNPQCNAKTTAV